MPLIEWSKDLSVGIDSMDEQHKKWIEIINQLDEALLSGRSLDNLGKIVSEMENYTDYHFAEEEKLMESRHYDDLKNHKRMHLNFRDEVKKLKSDLLSGEIVLGTRVMKMIKNWLEGHILEEDTKYSKSGS